LLATAGLRACGLLVLGRAATMGCASSVQGTPGTTKEYVTVSEDDTKSHEGTGKPLVSDSTPPSAELNIDLPVPGNTSLDEPGPSLLQRRSPKSLQLSPEVMKVAVDDEALCPWDDIDTDGLKTNAPTPPMSPLNALRNVPRGQAMLDEILHFRLKVHAYLDSLPSESRGDLWIGRALEEADQLDLEASDLEDLSQNYSRKRLYRQAVAASDKVLVLHRRADEMREWRLQEVGMLRQAVNIERHLRMLVEDADEPGPYLAAKEWINRYPFVRRLRYFNNQGGTGS